MTFYEELQLSSTGSKALIKNTTDPKEKRRHILIYNFKVYLVMAFCFVFVTLFSMLFGSDNSVAGVVFLLALLVLRQADFGIRTSHGLICIAGIFTLLITGPRLANTLPAPASLLVNFISILLLMILGCHNVIMYNQSTFVLGYLLLYGYDVTGRAYLLRVLGLLVSMMVCMLVLISHLSTISPSVVNKPNFTVVPPISTPKQYFIFCISPISLLNSAEHVCTVPELHYIPSVSVCG